MRFPARFSLIVIMALIAATSLAADRLYIDSTVTRQLTEVQTAIFNDQFARADSLAGALVANRPDDPSGYVTRAAGMLAHMSFAEENLFGNRFELLLDTIRQLCNDRLADAEAGRQAWMYLFLGHAEAYRSLYEAKFGSSISALTAGLRTRSNYSAGLTQDSGLADLYFGLGSYHYWKSVKAGPLRWLGIFRNDIAKGIDELRLAADSSLLSRDVSLSALAWIWLDRKEYDSAVAEAERLRARYPEGSSFLWPEAKALYAKKEYGRAHATFSDLRVKLIVEPGNYFNLIECDYYLSLCGKESGSPLAACADAARLVEYERYIPPATRDRQESKLRYLRKMRAPIESATTTE